MKYIIQLEYLSSIPNMSRDEVIGLIKDKLDRNPSDVIMNLKVYKRVHEI